MAQENPAQFRDYEIVICGQDWVDERQAARLLGLQTHHGQEEDQAGEVSLWNGYGDSMADAYRSDRTSLPQDQ